MKYLNLHCPGKYRNCMANKNPEKSFYNPKKSYQPKTIEFFCFRLMFIYSYGRMRLQAVLIFCNAEEMMSLIHYRQATKDDAQSLKDIAKRVISTNYVSFLGIDATAAFIENGMSDKEIDDGLNNCTLMICNGKTIGFAITNEAVLHLIMIDVSFQNAGYGSALLAQIETRLFSNFNCIHLQTFQENVSAVQFYLKNEWIIISQEKIPEIDKTMLQFKKVRNSK